MKREKNEQYKETLKLAGKMAILAREVINSDSKTLSEKIARLECSVDEYDNAILKISGLTKDD